eukprot:323763-Amphidinium_carterae.3
MGIQPSTIGVIPEPVNGFWASSGLMSPLCPSARLGRLSWEPVASPLLPQLSELSISWSLSAPRFSEPLAAFEILQWWLLWHRLPLIALLPPPAALAAGCEPTATAVLVQPGFLAKLLKLCYRCRMLSLAFTLDAEIITKLILQN